MPTLSIEDKQFNIRTGQELLQAYKINTSLPLKFGCCMGDCGTCVIQIVEGFDNLSKMGTKEKETLMKKKFNSACRLACQCSLNGDIEIQRNI
jgi:ferredoxin